MAYASWSVIAGEQPTTSKWNILGTNDASFNDGTGFAWGSSAVLSGGPAWTSYTPTWTGASSNPAIGNGTLAGFYSQVGKRVRVRVIMVAGSTTTFGSGQWQIALPVTSIAISNANALSTVTRLGDVSFDDTGLNTYKGSVKILNTTTARFFVDVTIAGANPVFMSEATVATGASPFSYGTGDGFYAQFEYEAA